MEQNNSYILSDTELLILSSIDKKYKWLARDKDGRLYLFTNKPTKDKTMGYWDDSTESVDFYMFTDYLFEHIKWEDPRPVKIQKAIEQKVLTQMLDSLFNGGEDELE